MLMSHYHNIVGMKQHIRQITHKVGLSNKTLINYYKEYVEVVEDDELAIAIGRNGHNIKLASQVTGYTIDAVKRSDYKSNNKSLIPLSEIKGISEAQILNFKEKDIISTTDFLESDHEILLSVKGIGDKTIEKITNSINDYLESQSNSVEDIKE